MYFYQIHILIFNLTRYLNMPGSNSVICNALPLAMGGVFLSAMCSFSSAFSGYLGGLILKGAGWDSVDPLEAFQMGKVGGAFLGEGIIIVGIAAVCCLFKDVEDCKEYVKNYINYIKNTPKEVIPIPLANKMALGIAICSAIGSLTGYGVLSAAGVHIDMPLAQTVASAAVGGVVTAYPSVCSIITITNRAAVSAAAMMDRMEEDEREDERRQQFIQRLMPGFCRK